MPAELHPLHWQMGPHTALADRTVREDIMTGMHFLGCKCCGTYDSLRHRDSDSEVAQVAFAWLKYEMKFSGSTGSLDSSSVGISVKGKGKHTDGQVPGGAPSFRKEWPLT